jgi:hypothetical protein
MGTSRVAGELTDVQQRILDTMRRDGIAVVSFDELFADPDRWAGLEEDIGRFVDETEQRLDEYRLRTEGKRYLVRRFVGQRTKTSKPEKPRFAPDDRWLSMGLSSEILDVVNAYRGGQTYLIDVDNWYTIPDPSAHERVESQQWHRDPWNDHIVKVFTYFSDVDEDAGPFEYVSGSPAGGRHGDLWPWQAKGIYPPQDEFERTIPAEDRLSLQGPAGTMLFCDTSGFHCGGWARSKPRILSYHTYVSPPPGKSPRFKIDWPADGGGLSSDARFAVSWSVKRS